MVATTSASDDEVKALAFVGADGRVSLHLVNTAESPKVVKATVGREGELAT